MSVHFKFKNSVEDDTVTFDGVHISVGDLKTAIIQKKKLRQGESDYQIMDSESKKVYASESDLVPKNSSVIVSRVPLSEKPRRNYHDRPDPNTGTNDRRVAIETDMSKFESEEDKINAAIFQSTDNYDASNYERRRGMPSGPVPPGYVCRKCYQPGHHIRQCPLNDGIEVKRSTGIPRSFMVPCDANEKGAYSIPGGGFAKSVVEAEAYLQPKKEKPPTFADLEPNAEAADNRVTIPEELLCLICHSILNDAVLVFCCAASCCDECVRTALIESDDHQCPVCHVKGVSPDTLIPCIKLRKQVVAFLNETNPLWQKSAQVSSSLNLEELREESNSSRHSPRNSSRNQENNSPTASQDSPTKEDSKLPTESPSDKIGEQTVNQSSLADESKSPLKQQEIQPSNQLNYEEGHQVPFEEVHQIQSIQRLPPQVPYFMGVPPPHRPPYLHLPQNMAHPPFMPRQRYDYPRRPLLAHPSDHHNSYTSNIPAQRYPDHNGYGEPRYQRPDYERSVPRRLYNEERYREPSYESRSRDREGYSDRRYKSNPLAGIDPALDYDAAVEKFTQHLLQGKRRSRSRSPRSRYSERRRDSRSPERKRYRSRTPEFSRSRRRSPSPIRERRNYHAYDSNEYKNYTREAHYDDRRELYNNNSRDVYSREQVDYHREATNDFSRERNVNSRERNVDSRERNANSRERNANSRERNADSREREEKVNSRERDEEHVPSHDPPVEVPPVKVTIQDRPDEELVNASNQERDILTDILTRDQLEGTDIVQEPLSSLNENYEEDHHHHYLDSKTEKDDKERKKWKKSKRSKGDKDEKDKKKKKKKRKDSEKEDRERKKSKKRDKDRRESSKETSRHVKDRYEKDRHDRDYHEKDRHDRDRYEKDIKGTTTNSSRTSRDRDSTRTTDKETSRSSRR